MVVMETSLELQCSLTHQIPFLRSIFPVDSAAHPPVLSLLQSDAAPKFGVIPCWFDSSPLFSFFMQPLFAVDSAAQLLCPCVIDFPTTFRHSSPSTSVVHCQRPPCRPCAQPTQNTATCDPRAVADQLEGNEEEHRKYRSMVVKHILDNREMFEPFIEDEVPFDEYCQSMENDGTWAGHMELQAASLVTRSNICIHRNMSPRWYLRNFDNRGVRMIHLSYHDGEHYNSVRLKDDPCDGPARPIIIKADADLSVPSHQTKVLDNKPHGRAGREAFQSGSIKLVMAGTGCENAEKVEQILEQVSGDVDAAIEFLIAEQGTEECSANSDSLPSQANTCGHDENENHKQHKEDMVEESTNDELHNSSKKTNINTTLQPNDKIPRNKVCPCGSKKKYKPCCGSALGKQSAKFVVNQAADSKKGKKERKQGKKGIYAKAEVPSEYDLVTPDMGALCI